MLFLLVLSVRLLSRLLAGSHGDRATSREAFYDATVLDGPGRDVGQVVGFQHLPVSDRPVIMALRLRNPV